MKTKLEWKTFGTIPNAQLTHFNAVKAYYAGNYKIHVNRKSTDTTYILYLCREMRIGAYFTLESAQTAAQQHFEKSITEGIQ